MALRRAGVRTLRLLEAEANCTRLYQEQLCAIQTIGWHHGHHDPPPHNRQVVVQHVPNFRSALPHDLYSLHWRYVQTSTDRKDESTTPSPDAKECDEAIESYQRARSTYTANLRYPSSYRTATERVVDIITGVFRGTVSVLRYIASIPSKLWALRLKSREDWAQTWVHTKKVVKEEAHHYWVGNTHHVVL